MFACRSWHPLPRWLPPAQRPVTHTTHPPLVLQAQVTVPQEVVTEVDSEVAEAVAADLEEVSEVDTPQEEASVTAPAVPVHSEADLELAAVVPDLGLAPEAVVPDLEEVSLQEALASLLEALAVSQAAAAAVSLLAEVADNSSLPQSSRNTSTFTFLPQSQNSFAHLAH